MNTLVYVYQDIIIRTSNLYEVSIIMCVVGHLCMLIVSYFLDETVNVVLLLLSFEML